MTEYIADLVGVCGCQWGVSGSSPEEVVQKTVKHADETHHMKEVPPEIVQKLKAATRQSI